MAQLMYSVWFEPAAGSALHAQTSAFIKAQAAKYGGPVFAPHITVRQRWRKLDPGLESSCATSFDESLQPLVPPNERYNTCSFNVSMLVSDELELLSKLCVPRGTT